MFEGRSNNWLVVLEVTSPETDGNSKLYKFSFIGEGNKPSVFNYEIVGADGTDTGEGTLKTQEEMWLNEVGNTKPVYKITQGPIIINWDGHTEELLLKVKN